MRATLQIIRDYLGTLAPDQICGKTHDGRVCLVHRAMERLHPGVNFYVTINDIQVEDGDTFMTVKHEPEIAEIVVGFDKTFSRSEYSFDDVTRAQVEEAFPQLRQQEGMDRE